MTLPRRGHNDRAAAPAASPPLAPLTHRGILPSAVVVMAAHEAAGPGTGAGDGRGGWREGRPWGQIRHRGGESARLSPRGPPARPPRAARRGASRGPPRERGPSLGEAAHGGGDMVPPIIARHGPGGHRPPRACRLEVTLVPPPSFCSSCPASPVDNHMEGDSSLRAKKEEEEKIKQHKKKASHSPEHSKK